MFGSFKENIYLCTTKGVHSVPPFVCSGWRESGDSHQLLQNKQFSVRQPSCKSLLLKSGKDGMHICRRYAELLRYALCPLVIGAVVPSGLIEYVAIEDKLGAFETCAFRNVDIHLVKQPERTGDAVINDYTLIHEGFDYDPDILRRKLCMVSYVPDCRKFHEDVLSHALLLEILHLPSYYAEVKFSVDIIVLPTHYAPVQDARINKCLTIGDFLPLTEEKSVIYHNKNVCLFGTKIAIKNEMAKKNNINFEEYCVTPIGIKCDNFAIKCDIKRNKV